jgi:hypothetical protein
MTFAIQDAMDRAQRHGWELADIADHRVVLWHRRSRWGVCITTDGMGHVVIYCV